MQEAGTFGQPITSSGNLAIATTLIDATVVGALTGNAVPFDLVEYALIGLLLGLFTLITSDSQPLTPGAIYYLSDAVAGQITKVAPTTVGHYVVPIGIALTPTTLFRFPSVPMLIQSP